MNYKEYLQSEHWKQFRLSILKIRHICQNCGIQKNLNIHHKHYKSLGNESISDVLVLCSDCHHRFHKHKRWIKKYKLGEILDFTGSKDKTKTEYYNNTGIVRQCIRCGENHSIFYSRMKNDRLALAMACPNSRPRTRYLPFEEGLDIPIRNTKAKNKSLQ